MVIRKRLRRDSSKRKTRLKKIEFIVDQDQLKRWMNYGNSRGWRPELKWIPPKEYLTELTVSLGYPKTNPLTDKSYAKKTLNLLTKLMKKGTPIPPLWVDIEKGLNPKERWRVFGSMGQQDGRHRAYVAYKFGIEKVPVIFFYRDD